MCEVRGMAPDSPVRRSCCWSSAARRPKEKCGKQQFYDDNKGKCCRKLLRLSGRPNKVT